MNRIQTITERLPASWACALINGDETGMGEDEIATMDATLRTMERENSCDLTCVSCDDEDAFTVFPTRLNLLPGASMRFTFHCLDKDTGQPLREPEEPHRALDTLEIKRQDLDRLVRAAHARANQLEASTHVKGGEIPRASTEDVADTMRQVGLIRLACARAERRLDA